MVILLQNSIFGNSKMSALVVKCLILLSIFTAVVIVSSKV
jgi:hypothetical protein